MQFEGCMRRVFGDDAYHIAGSCLDGTFRGKWVKRLLKQLIRDVQDIDTTQEHRERISHLLESCMKESWATEEPSWHTIFGLFTLIAELLGYQGTQGNRPYTPMFCQDRQIHLAVGNARGKADELQEEFRSAARTRAEVVMYLKGRGLSDFEVAMVLKTSEQEVKKLKRSRQVLAGGPSPCP